jgi:hypothetical protein
MTRWPSSIAPASHYYGVIPLDCSNSSSRVGQWDWLIIILKRARGIQRELANTVMSWAEIKRGRDLFVPGLSSFDIPNAVNAVFEFQDQVQSLLDPKPWIQSFHILSCSSSGTIRSALEN